MTSRAKQEFENFRVKKPPVFDLIRVSSAQLKPRPLVHKESNHHRKELVGCVNIESILEALGGARREESFTSSRGGSDRNDVRLRGRVRATGIGGTLKRRRVVEKDGLGN